MVVMRPPIWRQMSSIVRFWAERILLDLGEGLFDRIEVGGVWRQIPESCAGDLDQAAQGSRLVAAEIVHDDDVAGLKLRHENLLNIGAEAFAVDWAVEQARCSEAVTA